MLVEQYQQQLLLRLEPSETAALAAGRGVSLESLCEQATQNARTLLGLNG